MYNNRQTSSTRPGQCDVNFINAVAYFGNFLIALSNMIARS